MSRCDARNVNRSDFYRLHDDANGAGWCRCVAWWVATWEGWGERSADENFALRERLFDGGEFDGYLLYASGEPIGWCQVGPRDRLRKLTGELQRAPDASVWAISCFLIAPRARGRGRARELLRAVLADLAEREVKRVEAYPRRGVGVAQGEPWTGPEALYRSAGFECVVDSEPRAVFALTLSEPNSSVRS